MHVLNETHKEEGCEAYPLYVDVEPSHHFMMIEKWRSQSELDKHSHSA
ncbi:putative quinol monooxygenase [Rosenbergiella metrosideri]